MKAKTYMEMCEDVMKGCEKQRHRYGLVIKTCSNDNSFKGENYYCESCKSKQQILKFCMENELTRLDKMKRKIGGIILHQIKSEDIAIHVRINDIIYEEISLIKKSLEALR